jgi:hypothetical protein
VTQRKHFRLRPPQLPKLREDDIERACLDLLAYRGYYVIRLQTGMFRTKDNRFIQVGKRGLPDYVAVHQHHRGFLLETKRPGGALSPAQEKTIWEIQVGYRIPVAKIDHIEQLSPWLDIHEATGITQQPPTIRSDKS